MDCVEITLSSGLNLTVTTETTSVTPDSQLEDFSEVSIGNSPTISPTVFDSGTLSGHFSRVHVTGSFTQPDPNLTGLGNISISLVGSDVYVSGNTGAYANFTLKSDTGIFITTGQSGQFASSSNLFNTGANLQSQINSLSGTLINTGNYLYNLITGVSGSSSTSTTSSDPEAENLIFMLIGA